MAVVKIDSERNERLAILGTTTGQVISLEIWPRLWMAAAVGEPTEEASKGVLSPFVANSSALLSSHSRLLLGFFRSLIRESGSHNPEGRKGALPVADKATAAAGQALGFAQTR